MAYRASVLERCGGGMGNFFYQVLTLLGAAEDSYPKNENSSIPSVQEQDLFGARLFHQLEISGEILR